MNVLVGADPEVFVLEGNAIGSAIGRIKGTKEQPFVVQCGAVQVDNVLAEFNINPAASRDEFVHNISTVMQQLGTMVDIDIRSSYVYTEKQLMDYGPDAFVFGCEPDFNAYTGDANPKPKAPNPGLRTAGGHIHVGYSDNCVDTILKRKIVIAMDVLLGLPSVMMDPDTQRRLLYGGAGAYRPKKYGVEYRTLSNFWLASPELMQWAYDRTMLAVNNVDKMFDFAWPRKDMIQQAINTSDVKLATALLKQLED